MIMQNLFNSAFLHDKELIHFFLGELLLGVDVEPIPDRVPKEALVDVGLVEGLKK